MFLERQHIPCYLERMGHKQIKIGKDEFKGTELVLKIDPLTPEIAGELEAVKAICFRRNDADVNPSIDAVSFSQKPKAQVIEIRAEPSLKHSVKIAEAKISKIQVRKPKDGQQWVLKFRATFAEVSGQDLLYLKEALFEQRYFSFFDAQGGLFEEAEAEARRESRAAKPVKANGSGDSATAH